MSKFLKFSSSLILTSILFGAFILVFNIALSLFFDGKEVLDDLTINILLNSYVHSIALVFVALLIVHAFGHVSIGRPSSQIVCPPLSSFTKGLILFVGLPILGLIISMFFVRLVEILAIPISSGVIVAVFTLFFWAYGFYKCKTVFFKSST